MTMTQRTIDADKVGAMMRRRADKLSEVGEFLLGFQGDDMAMRMYAQVLAVQSFLCVDAEEIETGKCCCRHVSERELEGLPECARCHGGGVSEYVNGETEDRK